MLDNPQLKLLVQSCGRWRGTLLLLGLVGAVFWPVLGFDFLGWDDDITVTLNPLITAPWSWALVQDLFGASTALRFKPLHWLALRGIHAWFGLNPTAWHAFGLLLHAAGAALFLGVLRTVLRRLFPTAGGAVEVAAWLGAALWAVHPLRVEPVAWITGSTYPLTTVFLLAAYRLYLGGRLTAAALLALAAYASYPVGVTFGLWLIATDAGLLRVAPGRPWALGEAEVRRWWLKQLAFMIPAALAVGVTLWTRLLAPGTFNEAPPSSLVPMADRLLMGAATLTLFVGKFLWPTDLTPNLGRLEQSVWTEPALLGAAVVTLLVLGTLAGLRNRRPVAFWVGAGFAGLSLPCLGLTEFPTLPVDRYNHLPDLILAGGLSGAGLLAWQRFRPQGPGAAAGGFAALAILVAAVVATRSLLPAWRDTDSLFSRMEQHADFAENPRQQAHVYRLWVRHAVLGGREAEAKKRLAQAFEVYHTGIVGALRQGDLARAIALSRSMEANLEITAPQRRERAYWLMQTGRWEEARRDMAVVAAELPEDARTQELMAYLKAGALPEHSAVSSRPR